MGFWEDYGYMGIIFILGTKRNAIASFSDPSTETYIFGETFWSKYAQLAPSATPIAGATAAFGSAPELHVHLR